jgi:hypothetical protein
MYNHDTQYNKKYNATYVCKSAFLSYYDSIFQNNIDQFYFKEKIKHHYEFVPTYKCTLENVLRWPFCRVSRWVCEKNRPKCSPTHICQNITIAFPLKKWLKFRLLLHIIFKKTAQFKQSLQRRKFAQPRVDVITIFCEKIAVFSQKPMLWPNFYKKLAVVWAKNAIFFRQIFRETILKS